MAEIDQRLKEMRARWQARRQLLTADTSFVKRFGHTERLSCGAAPRFEVVSGDLTEQPHKSVHDSRSGTLHDHPPSPPAGRRLFVRLWPPPRAFAKDDDTASPPPARTEVESWWSPAAHRPSRLDTLSPVDVIGDEESPSRAPPSWPRPWPPPSVAGLPAPASPTAPTRSARPPSAAWPRTGAGAGQRIAPPRLGPGQRHGSIGRGSAAVDLKRHPSVALDRIECARRRLVQLRLRRHRRGHQPALRTEREGGHAYFTYGQYYTDVKTARNPSGRRMEDGNTFTVAGWQGLPVGEEGSLTLSAEYRYRNPTSRGDLDPRVLPTPKVTSRYGDAEVEDITVYANLETPLSETWTTYGWLGYQHRDGNSAANPRLANNANNVPSIFPNGFLPLITTDIDDWTGAAGLRGMPGGFAVDATVAYGSNYVHYGVENSVKRLHGLLGPRRPLRRRHHELQPVTAGVDLTRSYEMGLGGGRWRGLRGRVPRRALPDRRRHRAVLCLRRHRRQGGGRAGLPGLPAGQPGEQAARLLRRLRRSRPAAHRAVRHQLRHPRRGLFGLRGHGERQDRRPLRLSPRPLAPRGGVSTGFRAPALQQQYFTATSTNFIIIGGVATPVEVGTFPATSAVAAALGAQPLEPEESINYSVGGVYHAGPFELTIDAYRIEIDNRIVLSENIQGSPTGTPTQIAIYNLINPPGSAGLGAARFFINGVDTETTGLDIVRYRWGRTASLLHFTARQLHSTQVRASRPATLSPCRSADRLRPRQPPDFEEGRRPKFIFAARLADGAFGARRGPTTDVLCRTQRRFDSRPGDHPADFEVRLSVAVGPACHRLPRPSTSIRTRLPRQHHCPIGFPTLAVRLKRRFVYTRSPCW